MRRARKGAGGSATERGLAAVLALADPLFVERRTPGFEDGFDAAQLARRLAATRLAEAPPINPLVDWRHLAAALGADTAASALEGLVAYHELGLPAGLPPHPLLRSGLRRRLDGEADGGRLGGERVARLLAEPDGDGRALVSILDPAFVLAVLGVRPDQLAGFGFRSTGRFYLAECVQRGVPPCAVFDPVHVLAATTGAPTATALDDPGAVLHAALAAYLRATAAGRAPSPSAAFDEAFVRATAPALADAVGTGRAASALIAWLDAGQPAVATTASGLEHFPEGLPHPWWQRERAAAAGRGRRRATPTRLTEEALQRVRAADPPALVARIEPGIPERACTGELVTLTAQGFACSPGGDIVSTELRLGDAVLAREPFQAFPRAEAFARSTDLVDAGAQLFGGFAVAWTGPAPPPGEHAVTLRLHMRRAVDGTAADRTVRVGILAVEPRRRRSRPGAGAHGSAVAIAMATFEPRAELLDAQLQSIRGQSLRDWRLTISDESVSESGRELISRMVRGDRRITLRHGPRVGVVGNFERALRSAEPGAPFLALADQDDRWHPDKLARLLARMDDGVALAHGAMRLVDRQGEPLPGAGATRRDAEVSLADLLAENQVTGAAALMRADVVRAALPLPRLAGLYHDHWLALVARDLGRIVFEPSIVQDYVQHGGNVVGEDPERDRDAAARLARERRGFAALLARLDADGSPDDRPGAAEAGLLPAAFGVVPAAVLRAVSLMALHRRRERADPASGRPADAGGLPDLAGLSLPELASLATALQDTAQRPTAGLGVAPWLAAGLAAIAAVSGRPGLIQAVAATHHRRAVAAATRFPLRPRRPRPAPARSG